jgi:hypothetical protein
LAVVHARVLLDLTRNASIQRYGGRISADVRGSDAIQMSVMVTDLMKEWNPILAEASDLKETMGTPTREEPGVLEYVFDNGLGGDLWLY